MFADGIGLVSTMSAFIQVRSSIDVSSVKIEEAGSEPMDGVRSEGRPWSRPSDDDTRNYLFANAGRGFGDNQSCRTIMPSSELGSPRSPGT
jgi:hypothetical protein